MSKEALSEFVAYFLWILTSIGTNFYLVFTEFLPKYTRSYIAILYRVYILSKSSFPLTPYFYRNLSEPKMRFKVFYLFCSYLSKTFFNPSYWRIILSLFLITHSYAFFPLSLAAKLANLFFQAEEHHQRVIWFL